MTEYWDIGSGRTEPMSNDAASLNDLGVRYPKGEGVPQDFAQAAECYRRAAQQDLPVAHYNLATLIEQGHGVAQDLAEAARLCRIAAERRCVSPSGLVRRRLWSR